MVDEVAAPDRGDILWFNFSPTRGHEQRGRRPAVVITPKSYNQASDLCLVCPITSQQKGYPLEVPLMLKSVKGVVLTDQIRTFDWKERRPTRTGSVSESILKEIQHRLRVLID